MGGILLKIIDFEEVKKLAKKTKATDWYNWVEEVLKNKDRFVMPPKMSIPQDSGNYYHIMPAMYEDENIVTVKMIRRHFLKENEKRPTMMADMMLYEADTGILKALMDAEYITTLRNWCSSCTFSHKVCKKRL